MTLPNMAFFPQALLPLHIFEPRYRRMLRDVLATNRLFAVAGLDQQPSDPSLFEPVHRIASVGIIRACQKNDNGTSNLLLQGLCRVEIKRITRDEPYRKIEFRALTSDPGAMDDDNDSMRREITRLIQIGQKLGGTGPTDLTTFLKTVHDPDAFVDIAAFNLCQDCKLKQRLLETLDVNRRLRLLGEHLRTGIDALKLQRQLQGRLSDDHIVDN
ncbi:MAG: LON peptidase substrate-binding domain-containing protein [Opitutaceae bacterium]